MIHKKLLRLKQFTSSSFVGPWPHGANGPLFLNGDILFVSEGQVYDFSSITLINGAAIENLDAGNDGWVIIGCKGDFTFSGGSAIYINQGSNDLGSSSPHTAIAPDDLHLSYTILPGIPGTGGGGRQNGGNPFGANAPGGGGNDSGTDADAGEGGGGGGGDLGGSGGAPGQVWAGDGGPGVSFGDNWGPGGGGGASGFSGQGLYIKVHGNIIDDGSNAFDLSGGTSGNGGNGDVGVNEGGGGGGGAGGGGGGKLVVRRKVGNFISPIAVNGGNGGTGGLGGGGGAGNGGDGTNGGAGTVDNQLY